MEAGRWAKPNKILYENRKCKICDTLEDEFHFVISSPEQSSRRTIVLPPASTLALASASTNVKVLH